MPLIQGPRTSEVSKEQALAALEASRGKHPSFPKNASVEIDEVEGYWVAAVHTAGPFPPSGGGEDSGPPSKGGPPSDDEAPDTEDGPPGDSEDGPPSDDEESGPPKEDKGKGGVEHSIAHLTDLVTQLCVALGVAGPAASASPVPGAEDAPPPPGGEDPAAPPGAGGPPGADAGHKKVDHLKALKPGEAPPGTTPVGSPAFSRVDPNHPWHAVAGVVPRFKVKERISNDESLGIINQELQHLAKTAGYGVERLWEDRDEDGNRLARAVISAYVKN